MRVLGFFLLVGGGFLVLAAVALLTGAEQRRPARAGFVVAGLGVEAGGFAAVARSFRRRSGKD